MNKFTVYHKKADQTIGRQLKIITREVKKSLGNNFVSLVLFGGFARGEGSVLIKKSEVIPLNDFDLYVITKKPVPQKELIKISQKTIKKTGIKTEFSFKESQKIINFYIDLRGMTLKEIKKTPPLLKYFEIKNSGRILAGKNVLKMMPDIKIEDVPLQDGLRFLFNRLCMFLEYFKPEYLARNLNEKEKLSVVFFLGKAYLSIGEALLLSSRKFVASYQKRERIFKETFKNDFPVLATEIPDLEKKVSHYTQLKIRPVFTKENSRQLFFSARADLFKVIEYYLKQNFKIKMEAKELITSTQNFKTKISSLYLIPYFNNFLATNFPSLSRLLQVLPRRPTEAILNFAGQVYFNWLLFKRVKVLTSKNYFGIFRDLTDPGLKFYSAALLCLFALSPKGRVNKAYLLKAIDYLKTTYPSPKFFQKTDLSFWEEVADYFTTAFRAYQYLAG